MKIISAVVAAGLITGAFVISSRGDAPIPQTPAFPPTIPEPTTLPPTTPNPGDERPPRDPFTPYGIGPTTGWAYDDLTVAEKSVVDRGVDTNNWTPVHSAYNAATIQQAHAVANKVAAVALGVPDLASIGVVP